MRHISSLRILIAFFFLPLVEVGFSADVAVRVINGVIYVQGSTKNDEIGLRSEGDAIQVFSIAAGTTINRTSEVSISGATKLGVSIDLGSGQDRCQIEELHCRNLTVVDGPREDMNRDDIELKHVTIDEKLDITCGGGTDILILGFIETGSSIQLTTGVGDDVAMLYSIDATTMTLLMNEGDDFVMAGELYLQSGHFDGGSDTWQRRNVFDRLAGDVMVHLDTFEISSFDVLEASFRFENELSFSDDVMDTSLEGAIEAMEADWGY